MTNKRCFFFSFTSPKQWLGETVLCSDCSGFFRKDFSYIVSSRSLQQVTYCEECVINSTTEVYKGLHSFWEYVEYGLLSALSQFILGCASSAGFRTQTKTITDLQPHFSAMSRWLEEVSTASDASCFFPRRRCILLGTCGKQIVHFSHTASSHS